MLVGRNLSLWKSVILLMGLSLEIIHNPENVKLMKKHYQSYANIFIPSMPLNNGKRARVVSEGETPYNFVVKNIQAILGSADTSERLQRQLKRFFKYNCLMNEGTLARTEISTDNPINNEATYESIEQCLNEFFNDEIGKLKKNGFDDIEFEKFEELINLIFYFHRVINKVSVKGNEVPLQSYPLSVESLLKNIEGLSSRVIRRESVDDSEMYNFTFKLNGLNDSIKPIFQSEVSISETDKSDLLYEKFINPGVASSSTEEDEKGQERVDCGKLLQIALESLVNSIPAEEEWIRFKIQLYGEIIVDRINLARNGYVLIDVLTSESLEKVISMACQYLSKLLIFSLFDMIDQQEFNRTMESDNYKYSFLRREVPYCPWEEEAWKDMIIDKTIQYKQPFTRDDLIPILETERTELKERGDLVEDSFLTRATMYVPTTWLKTGVNKVTGLIKSFKPFQEVAKYRGFDVNEINKEIEAANRFIDEKEDELSTDEDYNKSEVASTKFARKKILSQMHYKHLLSKLIQSQKTVSLVIRSSEKYTYFQLQDLFIKLFEMPVDDRVDMSLKYSNGAFRNWFMEDLQKNLKSPKAKEVQIALSASVILPKVIERFGAKGLHQVLHEHLEAILKNRPSTTENPEPETASQDEWKWVDFSKYSAFGLGGVCFFLFLIKISQYLLQDDKSEADSESEDELSV